jgi:hypothetical protein
MTFHKKVEHLSLTGDAAKDLKANLNEALIAQGKDPIPDEPQDRITKLENDYKALQAKIDNQEARMGAASSEAAKAQAFLNTTG